MKLITHVITYVAELVTYVITWGACPCMSRREMQQQHCSKTLGPLYVPFSVLLRLVECLKVNLPSLGRLTFKHATNFFPQSFLPQTIRSCFPIVSETDQK